MNNLTNPNATKKNLTKEILTITRKKKVQWTFAIKWMDIPSLINQLEFVNNKKGKISYHDPE